MTKQGTIRRKEGKSEGSGGGGGGSGGVQRGVFTLDSLNAMSRESSGASSGKAAFSGKGNHMQQGKASLQQLQLAFRIVVPLLVLLGAVAFYFVASKGTNITTLTVDNSDKLKDVFFGGQPWIILCSDFKTTQTSDVFQRTIDDLTALPKNFQAGMLDCKAKLPSGMSTIERFGFDTSVVPLVIVAANGKKPVQASTEALKSPVKLIAFAEAFSKVTFGQPKHTYDLESVCTGRKACGLILHSAKLDTAQSEIMRDIVYRHRNVSFSFINTKKLKLSLADRLPASDGEPQVLFIARAPTPAPSSGKGAAKDKDESTDDAKKEHKLAAKAYKGEFKAKAVNAFIQDMMQHPDKLTDLSKRVTLVPRSSSSSSSSSSSKKGRRNARKGDSETEAEAEATQQQQQDSGSDAAARRAKRRQKQQQQQQSQHGGSAADDEVEAAQRERERQRRLEMEEEADDLIQAIVDGEEEDTDAGDGEGEGAAGDRDDRDTEEMANDEERGDERDDGHGDGADGGYDDERGHEDEEGEEIEEIDAE